MIILLAVLINYLNSNWYQLEIRERGIYYHATLVWENIIDYIYSKNNLLIIKYLNSSNSEQQLDIEFLSEEKEAIESIINVAITSN